MDTQESDLTDKIRQQFDNAPYPRVPLEQSPKTYWQSLYIHNLVTSYYLRNRKVIETEGKVILDAGCGSGYKSLILAEANPGAKIVGIDLSEESVKLAGQRLEYHGFKNTEFYALPIEELPSLCLEFDYINADEVLYLLPDLHLGLRSLKSVLKPEGILRGNLHSSLQRSLIFQAQQVFKRMGLMDDNPQELELELVREIMTALKDGVMVKAPIWNPEKAKEDQWLLANYLLQGDRGYTVPEMFAALRSADLEFVSMVNWRHWQLSNLFKKPENLPAVMEKSLPENSIEKQLHLYELLQPVHRLLDFWCTCPRQSQSFVPVSEWSASDWQKARVYLHPQLKNSQLKEDLIKCITYKINFEVSRYVPLPTLVPISIESRMAACLLPLLDCGCTVKSLVERWLKLKPVNPATLEPISFETALNEVKELLSKLENCLYVLLERDSI